MAVTGYNFWLVDPPLTGDAVKQNSTLRSSPTYTFTGLASDTEYDPRYTAVDQSGNESELSTAMSPLPSTAEYTPPAEDPPMSSTDTDAIDALIENSQFVWTPTQGGAVPGATIAITGPQGYYTKSYGRRSFNAGPYVTTDGHYRMASITKVFVAHAILQQVDAENMTLDDTLDQYVSDVPAGDQITIRHLLMMRSGVYDYSTSLSVLIRFLLFPAGAWTRDNSLSIIRGNSSGFTPGTAYQYSNSNYVLLGLVLEAVRGKPIQEVLHDDVIAPLGLTETAWPETTSVPEPAAGGRKINPWLFDAAGALTTTVLDQVTFAAHLRDGTLLSPESKTLWETLNCPVPFAKPGPFAFITGGIEGPEYMGYGLGLVSFGDWFGYNGGTIDFGTILFYHPPSGTVVAGMQNVSGTAILTPVFVHIAEYLYPGSMESPGYTPC